MHDSMTLLEQPTTDRLSVFLDWYGERSRSFDDFDVLNFPDEMPWLAINRFSFDEGGRYIFEDTVTTLEGSEFAKTLKQTASGRDFREASKEARDRWDPFFWRTIRSGHANFAQTTAYDVDRAFLSYEIGLFPFLNGEGDVSHIIAMIEVLDL